VPRPTCGDVGGNRSDESRVVCGLERQPIKENDHLFEEVAAK
jgi:hypothetical protein